jgi:hypothetical protein
LVDSLVENCDAFTKKGGRIVSDLEHFTGCGRNLANRRGSKTPSTFVEDAVGIYQTLCKRCIIVRIGIDD